MVNPTAAQLSSRTVLVAPNVKISVGKFVADTSLRKHSNTRVAFTPRFKRRFLAKAPLYKEKVESIGDRLIVTRTLNLNFKSPLADL